MASHSLILPSDNRGKLRLIGLALLFVVGFHLVFQPFQMRFYDWSTKSLVLLGYAFVTAFVLLNSLFVLPRYAPVLVSKMNANVKAKFVWLSLNVFAIGVGFFAFKVLAGFYDFSLERIGTGVVATLCVGAIPAGIFWLWTQKSKLKTVKATDQISIKAQRGDKSVTLGIESLLYFETQGNYVQIASIAGPQKLRCTLTSVANQLDGRSDFFHCHRAFIVRVAAIKNVSKEAHNHFAILVDGSKIPVSRDKVEALKAKLQTV